MWSAADAQPAGTLSAAGDGHAAASHSESRQANESAAALSRGGSRVSQTARASESAAT
jgi:hypothetical protein